MGTTSEIEWPHDLTADDLARTQRALARAMRLLDKMRVERDALKADLARVTAERDEHAANCHSTVIRAKKAEARAESRAKRVEALEAALRDARVTMDHARVFVTSRQKMFADGVTLYDELLARLAALAAPSVASEATGEKEKSDGA